MIMINENLSGSKRPNPSPGSEARKGEGNKILSNISLPLARPKVGRGPVSASNAGVRAKS